MADENERSWWRRTRILTVTYLAIGGGVSLLSVQMAPRLDDSAVLGIPLGLLGVTLIVPVFVLFVIAWAAERQRRLDQAHGFFED